MQPGIQELQQTSTILKFMHGNESVSKNVSCHVFKEGCCTLPLEIPISKRLIPTSPGNILQESMISN